MEELADQGYNAARAQLALELMYVGGTGEINRERAVSLLEAAIADGSAVAARMLGNYYSRVFASLNQAVDYYRIAAERGDPRGKFEIGCRLVSQSLSTPEELAEACGFSRRPPRRTTRARSCVWRTSTSTTAPTVL